LGGIIAGPQAQKGDGWESFQVGTWKDFGARSSGTKIKEESNKMCLHKPMTKKEVERYRAPKRGVQWGWKYFARDMRAYHYPQGEFHEGRWLDEKQFRPGFPRGSSSKRQTIPASSTFPRDRYRKGFHIYLREPIIREWERGKVVRKVKFRNPVVWGWQQGCPCVVAKELLIPRPKKGKACGQGKGRR
jgi:hypothetical protein